MNEPHVVPAATPEQFAESIVTRLFRHIALTAEQAAAARAIVARVAAEQRQIDIRRPGGWDQLLGRDVERDAALALLLTSDADRARFEAHAAELRGEQSRIRPPWERTPSHPTSRTPLARPGDVTHPLDDAGIGITMTLAPIGRVRSPLVEPREAPKQGFEGAPEAWLEFSPEVEAGLRDLRAGEEVLVLTWLDRADRDTLRVHPRDDPAAPLRGVFSTRSADRPNPIGLHRVRIAEIAGPTRVRVLDLEAVDGTPVLDVKPVLDRATRGPAADDEAPPTTPPPTVAPAGPARRRALRVPPGWLIEYHEWYEGEPTDPELEQDLLLATHAGRDRVLDASWYHGDRDTACYRVAVWAGGDPGPHLHVAEHESPAAAIAEVERLLADIAAGRL